jgi:CBS domain-containing protein
MVSKNFSKSAKNLDIAEYDKYEPQKAKDIMKCAVIVIRKDESIYEAIRLMINKHISGLPVVDDTGLVGIITEKDLLKLLFEKEFLTGIVEDYMTREVVSFDEENDVSDVCYSLMTNSFRRVPILRRGNIVGIISRADLIKANKDKFKPESVSEETTKNKDAPKARDVMKCGLMTITKGAPIYEAIEILATKDITGLNQGT